MVAPAIVLGIRGVQVLFSIIVLGLSAYIVDAWTNGLWDSFNFMVFTSVWTLLAVAYLVLAPTRFPAAAHKYAIAAVEFITMVFWFAAFVAAAVVFRRAFWYSHSGSFYGSGVAAIVFSAFLWLTFVATTVLSALHIRRTPRNDTAPPPDMAGV